MTSVAITGSSGFVGRHIARAFADRGWNVVRFDRPSFDLGNPHPPPLEHVDILIHCARSPHTEENLSGSRRLFQAARLANVRSIVFVSSLSANPAARSTYAREKYALEQLLDPERDVIVRPGLVIGDGGLYASMTESLRRFAVAPLIDGGIQPVYTIDVTTLAHAIRDIVAANGRGLYVLAHPRAITLRELYERIAASAHVRVRLVPIPYALLLGVALVAQWLHIPLPLSVENIRSVRNLRHVDVPKYTEVRHEL